MSREAVIGQRLQIGEHPTGSAASGKEPDFLAQLSASRELCAMTIRGPAAAAAASAMASAGAAPYSLPHLTRAAVGCRQERVE